MTRVYTDGPGRYDWVVKVNGVTRYRGDAWSASIEGYKWQRKLQEEAV